MQAMIPVEGIHKIRFFSYYNAGVEFNTEDWHGLPLQKQPKTKGPRH